MKLNSPSIVFFLAVILLIPVQILAQSTDTEQTILDPFRDYFTGTWQGSESGAPGNGAGIRTYESIVQNNYILMKNQSVFAPEKGDTTREFHEDWGVFSLDRRNNKIVYRQFNSENFVNTFESVNDKRDSILVFETRDIENLPDGWKARITISQINPYKFTETFELSRPNQKYQRMLQNTWIKTNR